MATVMPTSFALNEDILARPLSTGSSRDSTVTMQDSSPVNNNKTITTPGMPQVVESTDLINMFTSTEMGVVSTMDRRDEHLLTIAEVKRGIARAERELAEWRAKEAQVLHRLQCISQEVAERRLTQADINIERAKFLANHYCIHPRFVANPADILTTLSVPSMSLADGMRVA